MTQQPAIDVRQVLVHPAVWPHLELWLATRGLVLGRVPVEDDLPTYAMVLADPGDAEKVVRAAARQATAQPAAAVCACGHAAHRPGTECEDGVTHGPKRWHRCLCLNRVGANTACPPDMDCQGGTLGYSDVWHRQRAAIEQPDPTIADDPTPLRWGLNDVLHSDDDTVIVCLSGPAPDHAPYWLELDPDRAAVLRDDLTPPAAGLAAPTNHDTEPPLTAAERQFLTFALDQAADHMLGRDGFTDEDEAALARFRRLAAGAES